MAIYNRREFLGLLSTGVASLLSSPALSMKSKTFAKPQQKRNILFIAVDDLRPELGCYGQKHIISPNMNALAQEGTLFEYAYCQEAVCAPSRNSLMTGLRPDAIKCYDLATHFRQHKPDVVTLPQHFKNHGYHAESIGKVYHPQFKCWDKLADRPSWSVPEWYGPIRYYYSPEGIKVARQVFQANTGESNEELDEWTNHIIQGLATEAPDVADNIPHDGQVADRAIQRLQALKDKPFFLGVGFIRPHLPFVAPIKYWDMYDRTKIKLADNPLAPTNIPPIAMHNSEELRLQYVDMPKEGPIDDDLAKRLIHGYYACVSYVDAQIGRVIAELDRLGLRDNTIIVLWGDHGWHLGDHGLWCKHTNFETATRSPLIISNPSQKAIGQQCKALVEFVDIYPTLCELCGLDIPDNLEGLSLVPLLENPNLEWKKAAFSQYPRPGLLCYGAEKMIMGYTMRTQRYRYTEWIHLKSNQLRARELYDHKNDPGENVNVIGKIEYAETVKKLKKMMKLGWRGALPANDR
jgi:arylsulfatase A-like enzyme